MFNTEEQKKRKRNMIIILLCYRREKVAGMAHIYSALRPRCRHAVAVTQRDRDTEREIDRDRETGAERALAPLCPQT